MKKKTIFSGVIAALLIACVFTSSVSASSASTVDTANFNEVAINDGVEQQWVPAVVGVAKVVGYGAAGGFGAAAGAWAFDKVTGIFNAEATAGMDYADVKVVFDN